MSMILKHLKSEWYKYVLEILVITIGILGAFALNNWNENRKEQANEQVLLTQLKEEYLSNLTQLDSKIATRNVIINSSRELLVYFDNPQTATLENLLDKISNLGLTVTYDPIDNDLFGSGNINRITNPRLKSLLTSWSTDVVQVQEVEAIYLKRYHEHILPLHVQLGIGRPTDERFWKSIQKLDFALSQDQISTYDYGQSRFLPTANELLDNTELEGYVSNSIMINDFINFESMTLRKQIEEILEILNNEIK